MTYTFCPLCREIESDFLFPVRNYNLLACKKCELLFIDPYPDDIHTNVSENSYKELKVIDVEKHYTAEVQFQKKYFTMLNQEIKDAKSVLDVGCGAGHLLERLKIYPSMMRVGIELNKQRATYARKKANCSISQIPVEDFSIDKKFDVILMINVLSHIASFDTLFEKLHDLSQRDGKILLKVGEFKENVKKTDIFDWGIPAHLHFLGLNTINYICQKYKFKILRHQRIPLSQDVFAVYRLKTQGRSKFRNLLKKALLNTPFGLQCLQRVYDKFKGERIYSSFIVLKPD